MKCLYSFLTCVSCEYKSRQNRERRHKTLLREFRVGGKVVLFATHGLQPGREHTLSPSLDLPSQTLSHLTFLQSSSQSGYSVFHNLCHFCFPSFCIYFLARVNLGCCEDQVSAHSPSTYLRIEVLGQSYSHSLCSRELVVKLSEIL